MIEFFSVIIIITLWINGLYILIKDGMILGFISQWKQDLINKITHLPQTSYWVAILLKPIMTCRPCMSSVHGIIVYMLCVISLGVKFSFAILLLTLICTVPIVYLTTKIIK
jgi:hypothetical protein